MKTQKQVNKRKSMLITVGVHSAMFLAAMIPVATQLDVASPDTSQFVIPIEFAEFAQSHDEALKAASPVRDAEVKPVVKEQMAEPDVIKTEKITEVSQTTQAADPVQSDVVDATSEVAAAEDNEVGDADVAASTGGEEATAIDGESDGTEATGEDDGHYGLDGTGVITRKVIHREDVTKVAKYNGVIAINLCIDRQGRVIAVANNAERTTITDSDLIRKALDVAAGYRFETDYSAAKRECGVLTFVFDIDKNIAREYLDMD